MSKMVASRFCICIGVRRSRSVVQIGSAVQADGRVSQYNRPSSWLNIQLGRCAGALHNPFYDALVLDFNPISNFYRLRVQYISFSAREGTLWLSRADIRGVYVFANVFRTIGLRSMLPARQVAKQRSYLSVPSRHKIFIRRFGG